MHAHKEYDAEITGNLHIKVDAKGDDLHYNRIYSNFGQCSLLPLRRKGQPPTLYSYRYVLGSRSDLKNKRLEEGAITVGKENIF